MAKMNLMLQFPLCQWFLPHPKERQKILPSTRLLQSKQMDNTELISPPPNQRPHLQPGRILPVLQIQHTMEI
jgi:hypothetical protein